MKKSLAIALWCLLCLPVFGQATYYGNWVYSGSAAYGPGALLTYPARTDNCETGSEPSGPYGCNPSATTGQQGATLSYLGRNVNLVSFTTDGSGIPTFVTSTNTFVNGQQVSFQYANESWLNTAGGTGTPLTITQILSPTSFKTWRHHRPQQLFERHGARPAESAGSRFRHFAIARRSFWRGRWLCTLHH